MKHFRTSKIVLSSMAAGAILVGGLAPAHTAMSLAGPQAPLASSIAPTQLTLNGTAVPMTAPPTITSAARDSVTGKALSAYECDSGDVCFWTGKNGTGSRCAWPAADSSWSSGSIRCSWADDKPVKSVWNRGTDRRFTGVAYYARSNYKDRKGCTTRGDRGNLAGTYELQSHRWITTSCG